MNTKKYYSYDRFYFFYNGQGEARQCPRSSDWLLPGSSTFVAPPEIWQHGKIPVFNRETESWSLQDDNFWRPRIREENLNITNYFFDNVPRVKRRPMHDFRSSSIPGLLNGQLACVLCSELVDYINIVIDDICVSYGQCFGGESIRFTLFAGSPFFRHNFAKVEMIFFMQWLADMLVMMNVITLFNEDVLKDKKLFVDSVGSLLKKNGPREDKLKSVLIPTEEAKKFLSVLVGLSKSYKHSPLNPEVMCFLGRPLPSVLSLGVDWNDFNKQVVFHNHSLCQIIVGMDTFIDIAVDSLAKNFCFGT